MARLIWRMTATGRAHEGWHTEAWCKQLPRQTQRIIKMPGHLRYWKQAPDMKQPQSSTDHSDGGTL